jgi:peptide-methionine (S)-S-oxide reductase
MKAYGLFAWIASIFILQGGANAMEATTDPTRKAYFAGGCFWCMEAEFSGTQGVKSVISGYMGGSVANPTYQQVSGGGTGHAEAVEVIYDPAKVTYQKLLEIFWSNIDPTDEGGQFADRGSQYRTGIFYTSDEEKAQAEASKTAMEAKLGKPVHTEITAAAPFYPAEEYHQDYYKKNAVHYNAYKYGSGRVVRLKELWNK